VGKGGGRKSPKWGFVSRVWATNLDRADKPKENLEEPDTHRNKNGQDRVETHH